MMAGWEVHAVGDWGEVGSAYRLTHSASGLCDGSAVLAACYVLPPATVHSAAVSRYLTLGRLTAPLLTRFRLPIYSLDRQETLPCCIPHQNECIDHSTGSH